MTEEKADKMKKLLLIGLLFVLNLYSIHIAQAGELSLTVGQRSMDAGEDNWTVGDWNFIQATYKPDNSNFYYGISQEEAEVSPISYFSWTYSMIGLIVGTEAKVTKNISMFGHIGYYSITNDISNNSPIPEGVYYYFNNKFHGNNEYDRATLENSDAFGGTIGVKISQPITDNIAVGFSVSHRLLKIRENLRVRFADNNDLVWAVSTNRDYSSTDFGASLNYSF